MEEVRQRVQLFSSLRASQRALSRCMHPARFASVRSEGRGLLIRLQAVSDEALSEKASHGASERQGGFEEALEEIDAIVASQLAATLEAIESLEFQQLRAIGPRLCSSHPEEVAALIDVMLQGDTEQDKILRLVEYLVTILCSEEWTGRRTVVREPADATPGLRAFAREMLEHDEALSADAESTLANAEASLIHGHDFRATRDEIREYKKDLGQLILHPRILGAAVSYNAAMWNQVAAQIDTSLGVDQLAEDLFASLEKRAGSDPAAAPDSGDSLRFSGGFQRVVATFGKRLRGEEIDDEEAGRVVSRFEVDGLRPSEVEAFQAARPTDVQLQVRDAVTVGCAVRRLSELGDALEALDVDPAALEAQALDDLMGDMNRAARRLFADSRYEEAFELSEVRTRNLTSLAPIRVAGLAQTASAHEPLPKASGRRSWLGLHAAGVMRIAGPILGAGLLIYFLSALGGNQITTLAPDELAEISPFLQSGHHRVSEGSRRFVGDLGPAWDYLGTSERRSMATAIAKHFESEGIEKTILLGPGPRVMASFEDGRLRALVPKPTAQP